MVPVELRRAAFRQAEGKREPPARREVAIQLLSNPPEDALLLIRREVLDGLDDRTDGVEIVRLRVLIWMLLIINETRRFCLLPNTRLVWARLRWWQFPDECTRNKRVKTVIAVGVGLVATVPNCHNITGGSRLSFHTNGIWRVVGMSRLKVKGIGLSQRFLRRFPRFGCFRCRWCCIDRQRYEAVPTILFPLF